MAERNITVQYKLRGDTLSNWKTKNPVLADREPAIVVIPADSNSGLNEPAVLLKVGDGTTAFNDLSYVSAIAGDVPAWAKAADKPTYGANEITGLADFVNGIIQDTDTQYNIVAVEGNAYQYKLMSKAKGATEYTTEVAVIDIPKYDDTALAGRVTALEGTDAGSGKSVRTIANEELTAKLIPENAKESMDTLTEIAAWIQNHPDDAASMNSAIAKLQAIVAGIGGEGEKATVVAYVTDAIAALKIGDYAKAADLTALAGRVTTLEGDENTDGSVAKALKDAKAYTDEKDTAMDTRVDALEAVGATKVEASETNGNIKINGIEKTVYALPASVLDAGDTFIFDGGNA